MLSEDPTTEADSQKPSLWDGIAAQYRTAPDRGEAEIAGELESILEGLGVRAGSALLEAGSGSGHISSLLASKGYRTTLLDFSKAALKKSKRLYKKNGLDGIFVHSDLFDISAESVGTHDVVWNSGVLEHFDGWQIIEAMQKMASVAKKFVIILVPNSNSSEYMEFRKKALEDGAWQWGLEILREDMRDMAAISGLEVVEERFVGTTHLKYFKDYAKPVEDADDPDGIPDDEKYLRVIVARPAPPAPPDRELEAAALSRILRNDSEALRRTYYNDITILMDRLKSLGAKAGEDKAFIAQLKTDFASSRQTIATLEGNLSTSLQTAADLEGDLASSRQTIATLEGNLSGSLQTIANLEGDLSTSLQTAADLEGDLASSRQTIATLEGNLSGSLQTIANLEGDLSTSLQTAADLEGGLAASRQTIADLEGGLAASRQTIADLEGGLAASRQTIADLEGGLAASRQTIADLEGGLAASRQTIADLEGDLLAQKKINSDLADENLALGRALEFERQKIDTLLNTKTWKLTRLYEKKFQGNVLGRMIEKTVDLALKGQKDSGAAPQAAAEAPDAAPAAAEAPDAAPQEAQKKNAHLEALREIIRENGGVKGIVVYPPTVDWNIPLLQRPQHMASHLARNNWLYFYCTTNAYDKVSGFEKISDRLYLTDRFDELVGELDSFFAFVHSAHPTLTIPDLEGLGKKAMLVYDYLDEIHPDVSGLNPRDVLDRHTHMMKNSTAVVATAGKLFSDVAELRRDNVYLLPNAVDYDHFHRTRDPGAIPKEIRPIRESGGPILGYFGAIAKWFDYELIKEVARARPDWNIVLIGWDYDKTVGKSGIDEFENIHYLGIKEYGILPEYAVWFDVCILPFLVNDITNSTSPIKLFEYMALGKPIVATPIREVGNYKSPLVAGGPGEFVEKVEQALKLGGDRDYLELVDGEARGNTWKKRFDDLDGILESLLERGGQGQRLEEGP